MSQKQKILEHLIKNWSITSLEALHLFGCFRLAARIKELRDEGYSIETEIEQHENGSHARYIMLQKRALA